MTHRDELNELGALEKRLSLLRPCTNDPPWEQLMFQAGRVEGTRIERSRARRLMGAGLCLAAVIVVGLLVQSWSLRSKLQMVGTERDRLREDITSQHNELRPEQLANDSSELVQMEAQQIMDHLPSLSSSVNHSADDIAWAAGRFAYHSLRQRLSEQDGALDAPGSLGASSSTTPDRALERDFESMFTGQDRRAMEQQWLRTAISGYGDAS